MKRSQIALTLYTLRDFCKTPDDVARTLERVKQIGYAAVQISGVCAMPEEDLRRMVADAGLVLCATHEPGATIVNEPGRVAERLAALGCRYTAYPHPHEPTKTLEDVRALARALDHAGEVLAAADQVLTYHNHHTEFRRFDGRLMLDVLYEETDPGRLQGEIDTYWVQHGGGDPVAWCRRLQRRLPLLHLKDFAINDENKIVFAEVGRGNLNWPAIIDAADAAGCEWFIVEQDSCAGDPFDSARMSYAFLAHEMASGD